jgi:hypothetical protein
LRGVCLCGFRSEVKRALLQLDNYYGDDAAQRSKPSTWVGAATEAQTEAVLRCVEVQLGLRLEQAEQAEQKADDAATQARVRARDQLIRPAIATVRLHLWPVTTPVATPDVSRDDSHDDEVYDGSGGVTVEGVVHLVDEDMMIGDDHPETDSRTPLSVAQLPATITPEPPATTTPELPATTTAPGGGGGATTAQAAQAMLIANLPGQAVEAKMVEAAAEEETETAAAAAAAAVEESREDADGDDDVWVPAKAQSNEDGGSAEEGSDEELSVDEDAFFNSSKKKKKKHKKKGGGCRPNGGAAMAAARAMADRTKTNTNSGGNTINNHMVGRPDAVTASARLDPQRMKNTLTAALELLRTANHQLSTTRQPVAPPTPDDQDDMYSDRSGHVRTRLPSSILCHAQLITTQLSCAANLELAAFTPDTPRLLVLRGLLQMSSSPSPEREVSRGVAVKRKGAAGSSGGRAKKERKKDAPISRGMASAPRDAVDDSSPEPMNCIASPASTPPTISVCVVVVVLSAASCSLVLHTHNGAASCSLVLQTHSGAACTTAQLSKHANSAAHVSPGCHCLAAGSRPTSGQAADDQQVGGCRARDAESAQGGAQELCADFCTAHGDKLRTQDVRWIVGAGRTAAGA